MVFGVGSTQPSSRRETSAQVTLGAQKGVTMVSESPKPMDTFESSKQDQDRVTFGVETEPGLAGAALVDTSEAGVE
ncbi:hypothetical protein RJT34_03223 [Clitoria ternatea]|uniref:Uncharacterized protein n=1 Tax=Clitoria ternatea TaxID=43366 RepID=A0AAN9KIK0_CLITE